MFIRTKKEEHIKNFFLKDIDELLAKYDPGLPIMKPDVLKQIKEIDEQRAKMMEEQNKHGPIMLQREGQQPVVLSSQEVIGIIEQQQRQIQEMGEHIQRLEMNKPATWPPQSPFAQPPHSPFAQTQNQNQSPFAQAQTQNQSPFAQAQNQNQSPFAQAQNQNQSPFAQAQNQNQSPFTQPPHSPFAQTQNQNQSPFAQTQNQNQTPFTQPPQQSQLTDIAMAEQRISELEKQNIELNIKFSQNFNELQRYKRMAETQKITINNLQSEKTDLLLNQKKHVTFA
jgi:hypothetical protein